MDRPLVSVIIPVFNSAKYISRCIQSVMEQDYNNIEVIIVDDGSVDRSLEQCQKIAKNQPNIFVFSQKNTGVSSARNYGIKRAVGKLVTFVDSDDYIDSCHISTLVKALQKSGSECSVSGYCLDYPGYSDKRVFHNLEHMPVHTAVFNMLSPDLYQGFLCNKMFFRSIIQRNHLTLNENIFYCEDLLFCAEYFRYCHQICCVPAATYHYRQHNESLVNISKISERQIKRMLTGIKAIRQCGKLYSESTEINAMASARVQTECARIFRKAYTGGADKQTLKNLKEEMSEKKSNVLFSPLCIKEKIKYITTCLCPRYASRLWTTREERFLH